MIRFFFLAPAALVFAASIGQAAEMTFYQLPAGSFPHDVAPAADGAVWFSGQSQGFAGRFDPKTGQLEKIPLGPGAAPPGVIVGPDGNGWVTEGGQNASARVDAKSKEVKLFPLPKEFTRANLNTLASARTASCGSPARTGSMGAPIPEPAGSMRGRRRKVRVLTASMRHRLATSGTHRSPATILQRSIRGPAQSRWWNHRSRASGRAASGRIPKACCG